LAALLARAEDDRAFLAELRRHGQSHAEIVSPAREKASWRRLLRELITASLLASQRRARSFVGIG
jgi:hypothetical protein